MCLFILRHQIMDPAMAHDMVFGDLQFFSANSLKERTLPR